MVTTNFYLKYCFRNKVKVAEKIGIILIYFNRDTNYLYNETVS